MKFETVYEIIKIKQIIKEVETDEKYIIRTPEGAAKVAAQFIGDDDREIFFVMCLNTKHQVVAVHRAHIGGLYHCIVEPREIFKSAILNNSRAIIVAHQHPSQDIYPSKEDIDVTKRLAECGKILGIQLLDHIIVNAKAEYYSFSERGYI